jgi:signal transduction histidine kinase
LASHGCSRSLLPATQAGLLEQGPAIALAAGLLASGLIAAAVHFGTISWRRERMLRRVNAALEKQIADTRRGEGELRKLSEGLEASVSEQTGELNETIVELETFNYSVSHDLRGPLGAVINFAAILQEDYGDRLDATGKDHLQRIIGSASSAVSMMDALLAFSRSGRTELRKTHLDMSRLVHEVCDDLAASLPHLRSAVKVGDLPNAFADESMIRFILTNLISNAVKFARKEESPEVEIGSNPGSNEVVYFVRDNGIGFDMRYAEKLFTVFERLHASDGYEGMASDSRSSRGWCDDTAVVLGARRRRQGRHVLLHRRDLGRRGWKARALTFSSSRTTRMTSRLRSAPFGGIPSRLACACCTMGSSWWTTSRPTTCGGARRR